jgi:hypothetical protein
MRAGIEVGQLPGACVRMPASRAAAAWRQPLKPGDQVRIIFNVQPDGYPDRSSLFHRFFLSV